MCLACRVYNWSILMITLEEQSTRTRQKENIAFHGTVTVHHASKSKKSKAYTLLYQMVDIQ